MKSISDFGFKFVFNVFGLENSTGCANDSLSIYDGAISDSNLITRRCGKKGPDLVSTISQLTAQFLSNSLVSDVGFSVSVYGKCIIFPLLSTIGSFSRDIVTSKGEKCEIKTLKCF